MVRPGDALPPGELACDWPRVLTLAAAFGDHYPLHREGGEAPPVVPGRLKLAALARHVHEWMGGRGRLVRLSAVYAGLDRLGDRLVLGGEVRAVVPPVVHVRLWASNAHGERTTLADAVVRWEDA